MQSDGFFCLFCQIFILSPYRLFKRKRNRYDVHDNSHPKYDLPSDMSLISSKGESREADTYQYADFSYGV
jgi:hypothetical protein